MNAQVPRTHQVIAEDKFFDLRLGAIGSYENAGSGRKSGVMLDDYVMRPILFLVGSDGPKPAIRAAIAGGVGFRVDVLEEYCREYSHWRFRRIGSCNVLCHFPARRGRWWRRLRRCHAVHCVANNVVAKSEIAHDAGRTLAVLVLRIKQDGRTLLRLRPVVFEDVSFNQFAN